MKKIITIILLIAVLHVQGQVCVPNSSCISFDGVSTYVQINNDANLELDSAMSVEAWIKATNWGINPWDNTIFCKHSWSQGEQGYVLRAGSNGRLSFNFAGFANGMPTSWKECISPQNTLLINTWYHVAGTFDGDTIRLYVNGILVADSAFHGTQVAGTVYQPRIGRLSDPMQSQTRYWHGKIDEVRVWNRALSQAEIQEKMGTHLDPSQETGLVGYWRLNDSTGTSVSDMSGSNDNGTGYFLAWELSDVPFDLPAVPVITQSGDLLISSSADSYQWFWNSNAISGATNQSYLTTQPGTYSVEIMDSTGCPAMSDTINMIPTGISAAPKNTVTILENPAAKVIRILLSPHFVAENIELIDLAGKTIIQQFINSSSRLINIDTGPLDKSLYLLRIYGQGDVYVGKVVVK